MKKAKCECSQKAELGFIETKIDAINAWQKNRDKESTQKVCSHGRIGVQIDADGYVCGANCKWCGKYFSELGLSRCFSAKRIYRMIVKEK